MLHANHLLTRRFGALAPAAIFAAALVLTGCGKEEPKPAEAPKAEAPKAEAPAPKKDDGPLTVKIGLAAPLTGSQAHIGLDIRDGAQLGVDDLNAQNPEVGGRKVKFELVAEDDEADPTKAANVAQKLVDAKVVAIVGHFNSGASIPASKVYSDAGIPQISPSSTNPQYTQNGYKTAFRVVANDSQQGPANAKYALEELKAKKIAVIDDSTAYGQGLADTFTKTAKDGGAEIVAQEHTTDKDTDFKSILTKIKSKKPDLIFFGGIDPQAGPMKKQMKELGLNAKLMGGDGIQTPNYIKLAGAAAEGTYASLPGLPKEQMPGGKQFLEKFKAKTGKPVELYAPMGYDAVFVFYDSMKRAGSTEPAKFLPEVGKTNYTGVIGPIAFDEKGDLKNGPLTIYVVKGGTWETVKVIALAGGSAAPAAAAAPDPKGGDSKAAAPAPEAKKDEMKKDDKK